MAPRRDDLGSWLEGTPGGREPDAVSRLGLPRTGPGALGGVGRRLAAVCLDWALSLAISGAFFPDPSYDGPRILAGQPVATLAVFAVSTAVLVSLTGNTIGHRLLGLRVVRLLAAEPEAARTTTASGPRAVRADRGRAEATVVPGPPGLVLGTVRTVLLCLVVPAVIWDGDGRGMHDVAARTAVVRR